MATGEPTRVATDHSRAPDPKPAKGVKIAVGLVAGVLGLLLLAIWGIVRVLR